MKTLNALSIIAVASAIWLAGCNSEPAAEPTTATTGTTSTTTEPAATGMKPISYEKGTKKVGDKGVCVVCMVKEGKEPAEEEVKLVLDYGDRSYVFCNEAEEAEFISDPKKYTGN